MLLYLGVKDNGYQFRYEGIYEVNVFLADKEDQKLGKFGAVSAQH